MKLLLKKQPPLVVFVDNEYPIYNEAQTKEERRLEQNTRKVKPCVTFSKK